MRTAPFVEASIQAYTNGFCQNSSKETKIKCCYPRNEALVKTCYATSSPNMFTSLEHWLQPVGSHLRFKNLQRLAKRCNLHNQNWGWSSRPEEVSTRLASYKLLGRRHEEEHGSTHELVIYETIRQSVLPFWCHSSDKLSNYHIHDTTLR
jgi:hypothetical protein